MTIVLSRRNLIFGAIVIILLIILMVLLLRRSAPTPAPRAGLAYYVNKSGNDSMNSCTAAQSSGKNSRRSISVWPIAER